MRTGLVIISILIFSSCTINKSRLSKAKFISTCFLHRHPSVILTLSGDNLFKYKFAYLDEDVVGSWHINSDTLFLKSIFFQKEYQAALTPSYKYTDYNDSTDAFILKKNKLYKINDLGQVQKDCYLKRATP